MYPRHEIVTKLRQVVKWDDYGSRAVLKFSQYTGANAMAGRWMPGTLTNQITTKYLEPRLLVVTDPRTDQQAIKDTDALIAALAPRCHRRGATDP